MVYHSTMKRQTFRVKIEASGDVFGDDLDLKKLFFDFGLDGKLHIYRDVNHKQPVFYRLGSTGIELVR